jgi:hypothetical protein
VSKLKVSKNDMKEKQPSGLVPADWIHSLAAVAFKKHSGNTIGKKMICVHSPVVL